MNEKRNAENARGFAWFKTKATVRNVRKQIATIQE
jgi:hypothetical protein